MSEDLDITQLETPEILELIQDDLYEGLADEVVASVNELLAREMTPYDLLNQGLVAGMDIVGADFRDGILFVPEVLMAAKRARARRARKSTEERVPVLLRLPPGVVDWLDERAAAAGVSRNRILQVPEDHLHGPSSIK